LRAGCILMKFNLHSLLPAITAGAMLAVLPGYGVSADAHEASPTANAVITVKGSRASLEAKQLASNDVFAYSGTNRAQVTSLQALKGDNASMQLFIFLDDSTRSGVLGTQIPELKNFVRSLPPSTQVAIGYMRNGGFDLVQKFTEDHEQAANAVRLPTSTPGINGSPYFALSYLVKHWPSKEETGRRAVLMLTDGVDRYYDNRSTNDPYVDAAIKDSQHFGVLVYSIYMHGAGLYSSSGWGVTMAQSRLDDVSKATGGELYTEGLTSPVSLAPYLSELTDRLNNQYRITFVASKDSGLQPVRFKTEVPGVKIIAPQKVLVKASS
jgi:hypothetical protein